MTDPVWMASPPEVHSALLSAGPGPGGLLTSAAAWSLLSAEYEATAGELDAILTAVQAGAWQGPSAEQYVAAHQPYLAWLALASADSVAAATRQQTTAAAYASALAAMPTLGELAANHATHAMLVGTNFFGINTIPIAVNEADYARMWIQAAVTMTTYQAVADAQVVSMPAAASAPPILKADAQSSDSGDGDDGGENPLGLPQWLVDALEKLGIGNSQLAHDPTVTNPINTFIADVLKNVGIHWNPGEGTLNGLDYDAYTNPGQWMFWVARSLELLEDFEQFGVMLTQNPVQAFQWLVSWALFDFPTHILEVATFLSENPALFAAVAGAGIAPIGSVGGLAGLAGLAVMPSPAMMPPVPPVAVPEVSAGAVIAPPTPAIATPPAPALVPAAAAPAAGTAAGPPPAPPPPAAPAAGFFPPYLVPPGIGTGSQLSGLASSSARKKTTEPDGAAAASVAEARRRAQQRRRHRAKTPGRGDEYLDMNVDVIPDWQASSDGSSPPGTTASRRGAGTLGFAGTEGGGSAEIAGLVTLPADLLGDGPRVPLMPASWEGDHNSPHDRGPGRD